MCQALHPQSRNPARHLADKIGYPRKTLPWTDKFCHFVRFETPRALPQPKHLRSCVMRDHHAVIPAKAEIQRKGVGLPRPAADILSDDPRYRSLTDRWIPAFAGMTSVRQGDVECIPSLGPQPFALSHPPLLLIHQFSLFNLHFAICNSPPPDTPHSW
ncbi:MAG: hypothetical protein JWP89_2454 [Schlesneria sp.]|nr:hypothetical protein [Schlesneria sp.]